MAQIATEQANENPSTLCCSRFYEQESVRAILGDSFHPGGLELSARLVHSLGLPSDSRVLDVACGIGSTTLMMARQFGLDPVGMDFSENNLTKARARSAEPQPVLVEFLQGSADKLDFEDAYFDAIICECALSTFPDQSKAVAEFARVLKEGGVVGLSDMSLEGTLPDDLGSLLSPWTCLVGARPVMEYQRLFLDHGLRVVSYADETEALLQLISDLKRKLLLAGFSKIVGGNNKPGIDVGTLRDLLNRSRQQVEAGTVQYCRLLFAKGRPKHRTPEAVAPKPQSRPCCDPSTGCC